MDEVTILRRFHPRAQCKSIWCVTADEMYRDRCDKFGYCQNMYSEASEI